MPRAKHEPLTDKTGEVRELRQADFAAMRPASEVIPDIVERARHRGRPPVAAPKQQVTLRLDASIIEHFKAGGRGWQTRINEALERHVARSRRKKA